MEKFGFVGVFVMVCLWLAHVICPLTRLRRELPQRGSLSCHGLRKSLSR